MGARALACGGGMHRRGALVGCDHAFRAAWFARSKRSGGGLRNDHAGGCGPGARVAAVNTWKVILATLVIFGTGVVTGGLLVVYSNNMTHHQEKPVEAEIKPADAAGPKHPVVSGPIGAPGRENRPVI